ncbi:hypothetical protein [Sphingomonas sp.]|jgi:hypothetical protein|uniref:hypothetical protein n=1 Tax=Sphingomonas sp. TaxID=28214 RepID=UPI002ED9466C
MIDRTKLLGAAAIAAALWATPASAQATRTWVSGVGDDVNPCSRTAPCKTFAGAISKTAKGGEINCLDSGGFGSVTITKSIAIICEGVIAGMLAPMGSNAVTVNAAATDHVMLSGLDIHGAGTGKTGVRVLNAKSVIVRNSTIQGFQGALGQGVSAGGTAQVVVVDSVITNNLTGISGPVVSGGNNLLAGNGTDGAFASTIKRQ